MRKVHQELTRGILADILLEVERGVASMPVGDDILQMIVCLRDGKEAVEQLKAIYPDEAKNVALDIAAQLAELALQHRASAQHPKSSAVVGSSSDHPSSGDDDQ